MIYGIGNDIIEPERVMEACRREHFRSSMFTEAELSEAEKHPLRLASDFAAKEAVSKALRTGFRSFSPRDIECLRDELGAPYIRLYNGALRLSEEKKKKKIHISISDTEALVSAVAIAEI